MADQFVDDRTVFAKLNLGFQVTRPTASIAGANNKPLFYIRRGRVALMGIIGEVTTAINGLANAASLVSTPTTGTAVALSATLDIISDEIGCLYGVTGTLATAMVGANAGTGVLPTFPIVLPIGTLGLLTAADGTGSVKWDLWYLPLDPGAYVEAV